ncbi:MAG: glutamine amidotransferase [Ahrensia sp.]|nr:glutamine amidotransferase [Ahrensia sp.]
MHLAILMTNTDESTFAQAHPKDGEKFTALIHAARPDWSCEVFAVKDGVFPEDLSSFDGVMITGSPASVHDGEPWIDRLLELIREIVAAGTPLFGACFGHQAIALALGGKVETNPDGWVFGLTKSDIVDPAPWMAPLGPDLAQYGAHIEQVTEVPANARVLIGSAACPVGGFAIGDRVYTTQNHPEMSSDFVAALIEEYAGKLPEDVVAQARASLSDPADYENFAETIARFFEQATASPAG